ncbi:MAG: hypothetical protein J1E60_07680 [Christensenellaceae bacterium]|nr:hypothetical protein [Christensenellaceae bacterium]
MANGNGTGRKTTRPSNAASRGTGGASERSSGGTKGKRGSSGSAENYRGSGEYRGSRSGSDSSRGSHSGGGGSGASRGSNLSREISGICVVIIGILLGIFCYFGSNGLLASIVPFFFGLFGICMYVVPVFVIAVGVLMIAYPRGYIKVGTRICVAIILVCAITMIHIGANLHAVNGIGFSGASFGEFIKASYISGSEYMGGGFVGGLVSYLFVTLIGTTGSFVVLGGFILIMLMLITHISLRSAGQRARASLRSASDERRTRSREELELYNEQLSIDEIKPTRSRKRGEHHGAGNEPEIDDETGFIRHSGKPLTAGDSDYDYGSNAPDKPERGRRAGRKSGDSGHGLWNHRRAKGTAKDAVASEDDLEFFPITGTLKTEKTVRKRRQSELKPSFNTEHGVPYHDDRMSKDNFGYANDHSNASNYGVSKYFGNDEGFDNIKEYGNEVFDIPMNLTYADIERGGPIADVEREEVEKDYREEHIEDSPLNEPAPKPEDDILSGVTVTRMEEMETSYESTAEHHMQTALGSVNSSGSAAPGKPTENAAGDGANAITAVAPSQVVEYQRPPYSLLKLPDPISAVASESPTEKAKILIETLNSFSISARIINISVGPVITRFELQPAQGIRVNRITTLSNDIALALAAPRVRIEAPIPGKAAIGIEIPNKDTAPVLLREVLETKEFSSAKSPLTFALGKDIAGKTVVADLSKMPHMLIAGQTGAGKSVCINGIILSIVYKSSPKDVRMILIDPKVVELSIFSALPHLFCPVVTEPKKAAGALKWAVNEMDQRYSKMGKLNARDIHRYNSLQENEDDKWPRLVIIIDELADLMMVASKEVEESICRIAQLGRACGIHLIVATQRPSVDVITGLIKANIPSRIAFAVSNGTDSRVILDASGAEKLLGRGDMLFHANGASKPTRAQGAFVTDEEVEAVMGFFTENKFETPSYNDSVLSEISVSGASHGQGNGKQEDDLLPDAVRIVIESGAASISMIQRRLRVGYARAARLIDIMEQNKYVSASDGSKPRKVLIDAAEYNRIFGGNIIAGGGGNDEI